MTKALDMAALQDRFRNAMDDSCSPVPTREALDYYEFEAQLERTLSAGATLDEIRVVLQGVRAKWLGDPTWHARFLASDPLKGTGVE